MRNLPICSDLHFLLAGRSERSGLWPSLVWITVQPAALLAASTALRICVGNVELRRCESPGSRSENGVCVGS